MRTKEPTEPKDIIYVGIDNGVTGSIGAVNENASREWFYEVPVFKEQSYTKKKQNISRLDVKGFKAIIASIASYGTPRFFIERPMVNPTRFKATISAVRCLEATLIALDQLGGFRYEYADSKPWQDLMLPKGIKGAAALKKASVTIGVRLFPDHAELIRKHGDADGLLICEAMRRMKR